VRSLLVAFLATATVVGSTSPAAATDVTQARVPQAVERKRPREPLRLRAPFSAARSSDAGLIVGEAIFGASASALAGGIGLVATFTTGGAGVFVLLLAPVVTGGTVCAIGNASPLNRGSCSWAIAGAYAGAAIVTPLAYLALYSLNHDDEGDFAVAMGGVLLGLAVGATAGAIVGYNVSRVPRDAVASATPADRAAIAEGAAARTAWSEPLRRRGPAGVEPSARVVVPVLAMNF
jgi:hypothetical protein